MLTRPLTHTQYPELCLFRHVPQYFFFPNIIWNPALKEYKSHRLFLRSLITVLDRKRFCGFAQQKSVGSIFNLLVQSLTWTAGTLQNEFPYFLFRNDYSKLGLWWMDSPNEGWGICFVGTSDLQGCQSNSFHKLVTVQINTSTYLDWTLQRLFIGYVNALLYGYSTYSPASCCVSPVRKADRNFDACCLLIWIMGIKQELTALLSAWRMLACVSSVIFCIGFKQERLLKSQIVGDLKVQNTEIISQ